MSNEEKSGNLLKSTDFKTKGDFVSTILEENCVDKGVGAVAEVKDKDGKVATAAKAGKSVVNVDKLNELAKENGLNPKDYPNAGMARMNIGNMLRAAAKRRGGLMVNGKAVKAPADFKVNDPLTEKLDGSKIVKPSKDAEAKASAA